MKIGVLMLHGFSGGPYEVAPFATFLKNNTDWQIDVPTLSGHGEADMLQMRGYTAHDWLLDAEIAYRRLAKKVDVTYVVGFSMGGVIAMHLAQRYDIKKLVLLSAAAKYISPAQLMKDIKLMANDAVNHTLMDNELFKRYQFKLKNVPLSATIQFMKIVRKVNPTISRITVPTFIVQGELDGIVPSTTATYLVQQLTNAQTSVYISPNGKHHICYSEDCETWFCKVLNFLQN